MEKQRPLILITNDDGVASKGLRALIDSVLPLGDVLVVAPDGPRSAQSNAMTVTIPIRIKKLEESAHCTIYQCTGTPTDCVKIAIDQLAPRKPNVVVSGINHGANTSVSIIYSGTMGAAMDACVSGIPAIGFSLCSFDPKASFCNAMRYANRITNEILQHKLPRYICLNVNIPDVEDVKGIKICRQAAGYWNEEFINRKDPSGRNYYWLAGNYVNAEKAEKDTDEWAIENGFVSIVPVKVDMTAYEYMDELKTWNYGNLESSRKTEE